jgi:ABC-2 type transport system ATP-binding protein
VSVLGVDPELRHRGLRAKVGIVLQVRAGFVEFSIAEPTEALHALTAWAVGRGEVLSGLAVNRPSLEDVYLELTGSTTRSGGGALRGSDGGGAAS